MPSPSETGETDQLDQTQARIAGIFTRASTLYGQIGPPYFAYFGQRLVEHAGLTPGMCVLDVACGRGAVLFPAARAVGATGSVIGVDVSEGMVAATNADIATQGLANATAQLMDAEHLAFADAACDALTCGFALYFMATRLALAEFRRVVRPGGVMALSTWEAVNPSSAEAARWHWHDDLLQRYRPTAPAAPMSLHTAALETPEALVTCARQAGFEHVRVQREAATFTYASPEEWWRVRWSIFYRGALETLPPPALAALEAEALAQTRKMQARGELISEMTALFTLAS